jgi:tetratricopeptide (TPR) repeat protein
MKKLLILMFLVVVVPLTATGASSNAAEPGRHIPIRVRIVLIKINGFLERHEFKRAIEILKNFQDKACSDDSWSTADSVYSHPLIDYYLGNCYMLEHEYHQAARAYENALKKNSELLPAWKNLANAYYHNEEYDDAARCFLAQYELSSDPADVSLYYAALANLLAQKYDSAVQQFQRLWEQYPQGAPVAWTEHYVQALLGANRSRQALPYIHKLIAARTGEEKAKWQETLFNQYLQLNMLPQAADYASQLTQEDCTRPQWWKALAHAQLARGYNEQALVAMTIYRFLTPLSEQEQKVWADLNLQLGIPAQAVTQYHQLLKQKKDDKIIQKLVLSYRNLGQDKFALEQLERYSPTSDNAELLMLKGDLLYSLERFTEAAQAYRLVGQGGDQHASQAWLMAGYSDWRAENIEASLQAFDQVAGDQKQRREALAAKQKISQLN